MLASFVRCPLPVEAPQLTCISCRRRPVFMAGFRAAALQHLPLPPLDISSELIERTEILSSCRLWCVCVGNSSKPPPPAPPPPPSPPPPPPPPLRAAGWFDLQLLMLILMHVDAAAEAEAEAVASTTVFSVVLCMACCGCRRCCASCFGCCCGCCCPLFNLQAASPFSILFIAHASTSGTAHKHKRLWLHKKQYIIVAWPGSIQYPFLSDTLVEFQPQH